MSGKELILETSKFAKEDRSKSWRLLFTALVLTVTCYTLAILPLPLAGADRRLHIVQPPRGKAIHNVSRLLAQEHITEICPC